MAHELLIANGKAAMFYVDQEPWHGLGTKLKAPPTSTEAIKAAGLDWRVAKAPLYVAGGTRLHEVKDRFALIRETPSPPRTVSFLASILGEGAATYETAGALGKGERVWILARLSGDFNVAGGDVIRRYLLLSNSHDGTSSLQVKITPVRVVCNNTLTLALSQGGTLRVRHDRDVKTALEGT
jgi:hypothetical protein